jgi:hypothetical protein
MKPGKQTDNGENNEIRRRPKDSKETPPSSSEGASSS